MGGAGPAAALGVTASVLLGAWPRAVGGAASTALLAATTRAVALGAVPAGPRVLERASRIDTVVLCRTGTVTRGVRQLQAVHVAAGVEPDEALRLAGAVAAAAQEAGGPAGRHPVGAVIAQAARDRFGMLPGVAEFDGYPGLGVRGLVSELCAGPDDAPRVIAHATVVGRAALLAEHGIALPPELTEALERAHATGTTAVTVSWDGVARAVFEVADPVRPQSAELVRRLRGLGIVPMLLTDDDDAGVARGTAQALGVDPAQVLAPVATDDRLRRSPRCTPRVGPWPYWAVRTMRRRSRRPTSPSSARASRASWQAVQGISAAQPARRSHCTTTTRSSRSTSCTWPAARSAPSNAR